MKYSCVFALMCLVLLSYGCSKDNPTAAAVATGTGSGETDETEVSSSVYAFQTDSTYTPGNLKPLAGNFSTICSNAFATYSPSVSCTNFYAFLGKSSTNGLKSYITGNGLSATAIVKLVDGTTTIASSLQDLVDNGPMAMNSSTWTGWPDAHWYSGVAADGSAGNNCQNYTDDTSSTSISIARNDSGFDWTYRAPVCDYYDDYRFICLCN